MATVYYPTSASVYTRIVSGTDLTELWIGTQPDTIFVLSGSFPYTSSLGVVSITSSYAVTASYASSAALGTPNQDYQTVTTNSANWITCSFLTYPIQQIHLANIALYSFTASNLPGPGQVADVVLYISHSASPNTSSLSWPSSWINIGTGFPTWISSGKMAVLWLHATDAGRIMGTYTSQP